MEKRGVIEPGRTPPERDDQKQAAAEQLEDHVTKRAADMVRKSSGEATDGNVTQQPE